MSEPRSRAAAKPARAPRMRHGWARAPGLWLALAALLGLGLGACRAPGDHGAGAGVHRWATVQVGLHGGGASAAGMQRAGPLLAGDPGTELSTSYVVAVPADTPATPFFWSIPEIYDEAKADLHDSTVTLNLPLDTSIRLFEYVFTEDRRIPSIKSRYLNPGPPQISSPFTIASTTTQVDVSLPFVSHSFKDTFDAAALNPERWETWTIGTLRRHIVTYNGSKAVEFFANAANNIERAGLSVEPSAFDVRGATSMAADVTLTSAVGDVRGGIGGTWYHSPLEGEGADDATGDVYASLGLYGSEAKYEVGRCISNECTFDAVDVIGEGTVTSVGIGETVRLEVSLSGTTFTFTVTPISPAGSAVSTTFDPAAEGYGSVGAPHSSIKNLGTRLTPDAGAAAFSNVIIDNVSLNGTVFDDFEESGYINYARWSSGNSGAEVVGKPSGNALRLRAGGASTGTSFDTNGALVQVRPNRNLLLNTHRIAGNVLIPSAEQSTAVDTGSSQSVQVRAVSRLNYQPRNKRGDADGLSFAEVGLYRTVNGGWFPQMLGIACGNADCTAFNGAVSGGGPFVNTRPISLDTKYPFSLEYVGNRRVRGIFNGEARVVSFSSVSYFDVNDFISPLLRAQARRLFDAGDENALAADYSEIEVGLPAAVSYPTRMALPKFLHETFSGSVLEDGPWDRPSLYERKLESAQMRMDFISTGSTQDQGVRSLPLPTPSTATVRGLQADLRFLAAGPNPGTTGVGFGTSLGGTFFTDTLGRPVRASVFRDAFDGAVSYNVEVCDSPDSGNCQNLFGNILDPAPPASPTAPTTAVTVTVQWDGNNRFTFTKAGGTSKIEDVSTAGVTCCGTSSDSNDPPSIGLGVSQSNSGSTTPYTATLFVDNVLMDTGGGLVAFDNFNAPQTVIDPTKWEGGDIYQKLNTSTGKLELKQSGGGFVGPDFGDTPDTVSIAMDVQVTSATGDGRLVMHIDGPQGIAGVLGINGSQVIANVYQCSETEDVNCRALSTDVLGSVALGSVHTLYLQWDGAWFGFQLDNNDALLVDLESLGVTIAPPDQPSAGITLVSVQDTSTGNVFTQTGAITAIIDNVYVGGAQPLQLP